MMSGMVFLPVYPELPSQALDAMAWLGLVVSLAVWFFAENRAAIAVNQAVHWIYPEKKIAPGHSSNMAIFGQKDD